MAAYPFLSDEWMHEARRIREEFRGRGSPIPHQIRMNLCITDVAGRDGVVDAHMDSTSGELELELGHLDNPELTVTLDGDTARAIFIEGNPQAGMQAFMAGKIKIQGDMTKLMAMQTATPDAAALEVQQRLRDITA